MIYTDSGVATGQTEFNSLDDCKIAKMKVDKEFTNDDRYTLTREKTKASSVCVAR